jgi:hypothetical protein
MRLSWLFRDRLGRRGIAAVEFALVIPLLLVMFIGTIEVLTLYRTEAKLNALAFNVAQSVSITQSVSTASAPIASTATTSITSLNDICQGALLGLQPFPSSGLTIAIASVTEESGPAGLPNPGSAHSTSPTYDEWESDSTVTGRTCTTGGGSQIGGTGGVNAIAAAGSATTGMIEVPCDNAIIVRASLNYPGITGLILRSRPTLTQTAFVRWRSAAPTTELMCPTCTVNNTTTQICIPTNTAAN